MKKLHVMMLTLLSALVAMSVGCSTLTQEGELDKDRNSIERNIMDRLTRDDATRDLALGVRVQDGVATLFGTVPNEEVKTRARGIVEGTPGVTEVEDRLKVLSFSNFE